MRIDLICVGQRMPSWIVDGYSDYAKRLPALCALHLIEIPLRKRGKNVDIVRLQQEEARQMLAEITGNAYVIALDERGHSWNTAQLAHQLERWMQTYPRVTLLVGGPEGLGKDCLQRAKECWSLSALTLPHPLVRVIVAEQLYRAWSILSHHPYHRA
jgi:23S rRNA (pseudouridine1915-N3)-methyltransferase